MNALVPFIQTVSAPLVRAIDALAPAIADIQHRPVVKGDCTVAAFAVSSGMVALTCILWAALAHVRARAMKKRLAQETGYAKAEIGYRDALLGGGMQGVVVMRSDDQEREYYGNGRMLYELVLDSIEAPRLVKALDLLTEDGQPFAMTVRAQNSVIALRGGPVAGRAVLYLSEQAITDENKKFLDLLEALPFPMWLRDDRMKLEWGNSAFLHLLGAHDVQEAVAANAALDWAERDMAGTAIVGRHIVESRLPIMVQGERRIFDLSLAPVKSGLAGGIALDVTETQIAHETAERRLEIEMDFVNRLPLAIAVFDSAQILRRYNKSYARLWGLDDVWLAANPSLGDILSRLREMRRLPEQRQFSEWKKSQVEAEGHNEEVWHLPGGQSIRITTQRTSDGGRYVVCEDVSETLRLQSSLNLLTQVQKATLDTLDEAVAIFGTDGRIVLHNATFATMWKLSDNELQPQPHFSQIAALCGDRIGRDGIWGIVASGINSAAPEKLGEWGKARRADGRVISLSLSRLPNGATIVSFADLTDLESFTAATSTAPTEGSSGAAA